jgi:hypothetical protein
LFLIWVQSYEKGGKRPSETLKTCSSPAQTHPFCSFRTRLADNVRQKRVVNFDKPAEGVGFRQSEVGLRGAEAAFQNFETPLLIYYFKR